MGVVQRLQARADGWVNVLTGIGLAGRDKRMAAQVASEPIMSRSEQELLWQGSDMAARVVEVMPREMTREGWCVRVGDDAGAGTGEGIDAVLEDLGVHSDMRIALEWERAFGGAAILVGADDGVTDLRMPLREDNIKSIQWLTVMAAYELHPVSYYADPQAPKFGKPMVYQLHPDAPAVSNIGTTFVQVHESRLLIFPGKVISRRQQRFNNGWGDSVFLSVRKILRDYDMTWDAAAILMQDFAQAIMKVKGLAELLESNEDQSIINRIMAIDMQRSTARMVLLDSEENFERKSTPLTGMPDMLDKFAIRVSAAADMPVTLLMGMSPAGLAATGDSDVRQWYDRVAANQRNYLQPRLKRLVRLLMLAKDGPTNGREPKSWSIHFNALWQLTQLEETQSRAAQATADCAYINAGVVSPMDIAKSRFSGDQYSIETQVDFDALEAMDSTQPGDNELGIRDPSDDKPVDDMGDKGKPAAGTNPRGADASGGGTTSVTVQVSPAGGNVSGGEDGGPT